MTPLPARGALRVTLADFFDRYGAVLEAVANFVHARARKGHRYTTATDAARWVSHDLPDLYRRSFGRTPKVLRLWRVRSMLSHASYFGAFEVLEIRSVRGRGLAPLKKQARPKLRVVHGGRRAS